ncbi:hypothetical protein [Phyllobacterium endophyticum]|uniref:hypothetical protein n=1 Tax=Phyllobacterium endophyticum TaxID=1149773 RepID=UPI0011CB157D|nr:hypothetical protein [Phyllobacterium endophyticum]TXR49882.1 hypothetical protein FVA77_07665 [Phyllobacterium endophyticum]
MNGAIIYRGPSMLDGAPIVVIATGLAKNSRNGKTGDLVQTWILRDDVSPIEAVNNGADSSICGDCPHRGTVVDGKNVGRSCYVTVFQAPLVVWKSAQRGLYAHLTPSEARLAFAGRKVRLGAYGDPAAVPMAVWNEALADIEAGTGYTHQWRTCDQSLKNYVMASCDSALDHELAKAMEWRTFRVRTASEPKLAREVICPASAEAGYKTNCAACVACGGFGAKAKADIVIIAHGAANKVNAFVARA